MVCQRSFGRNRSLPFGSRPQPQILCTLCLTQYCCCLPRKHLCMRSLCGRFRVFFVMRVLGCAVPLRAGISSIHCCRVPRFMMYTRDRGMIVSNGAIIYLPENSLVLHRFCLRTSSRMFGSSPPYRRTSILAPPAIKARLANAKYE